MLIKRKDIDDIERDDSLERIEEKLTDISNRLRSMDSKQQVWDDIYKITQELREKEIQISYEKKVMERRMAEYNDTLRGALTDLRQDIFLQMEILQNSIMIKLNSMSTNERRKSL